MLSLYNLAVGGLLMHLLQRTLSLVIHSSIRVKGGEGGLDEEEEEDSESTKPEEPQDPSPRRPWAPCFYSYTSKETHYHVGQKIVVDEAFDSFAGTTWPGASALCHYLDTHREQLPLADKAVLEIGAGTGLVSIVATLLGGWVTATDLPGSLSHLRVNLSRNTRHCCKYTPQVAALAWAHDLEQTFPTSVYRYDYVLAADVVYHHDFLDELLSTMKHFCKPGTILILANKVRFVTDLTFIENFKKTFNVTSLTEDEDMKLLMATCRDEDIGQGGVETGCTEDQRVGKDADPSLNDDRSDEKEQDDDLEADEEDRMTEEANIKEERDGNDGPEVSGLMNEDVTELKSAVMQNCPPSVRISLNEDIYCFVGHDIQIKESIDSFGAVMWPAALALCSFLDNNRDVVDLQGKEVLELGAGTGLVSIVASLLGASVTATDLQDVLGNLRANVLRNTRGRCKHTPKVAHLAWGHDLERDYPSNTHRYDYVLAADVVYHHDFLDDLLVTMKHFCKAGTTLIWANKVRFETDLTFTDNFKKTFQTTLLLEDGEMKIFKAMSRK